MDNTDNLPTLAEIRAIPEFKPLKPKQKRFLIAYAGTGRITTAAGISKVPWITHYTWLNRDEQYKQAYEKAREMYGDYAEGEIFNRAFTGEERQIFKSGNCIEKYMQKSDILAMFALKGLKPQYRDNWQSTNSIGPISVSITYPNQSQLPDNSLSKLDDQSNLPKLINPSKD